MSLCVNMLITFYLPPLGPVFRAAAREMWHTEKPTQNTRHEDQGERSIVLFSVAVFLFIQSALLPWMMPLLGAYFQNGIALPKKRHRAKWLSVNLTCDFLIWGLGLLWFIAPCVHGIPARCCEISRISFSLAAELRTPQPWADTPRKNLLCSAARVENRKETGLLRLAQIFETYGLSKTLFTLILEAADPTNRDPRTLSRSRFEPRREVLGGTKGMFRRESVKSGTVWNTISWGFGGTSMYYRVVKVWNPPGGGGGGIPYEKVGDARRTA